MNNILCLQDTCNSPLYKKRLEGILHIIERKNRVEVRVKTATGSGSGANNAVVGVTAVTGTSSANNNNTSDEFDMYKGKQYHHIEPILCIQHMLKLLQN